MAPAIDTELAQKTESLKKKSPVGVVGTGLVGAGWAIVFARGGHPVRLFDSVPGAAERAIEVIEDRVVGLAEHKLVDSPESILENLSVARSLESAVEDVAYVQESVFEQVELKTKVLEALARCLSPNAVVGSSSSGIPASKFTEHLSIRSRVLIVHPVNPPYLIPLVELVPISANLICYDISRLGFFFCAETPPNPQRFRSNGLKHKKGAARVQQPVVPRVARRRTHASGWASGVVWN
jgi:hypothetical protein